jgi:hypothetical protein
MYRVACFYYCETCNSVIVDCGLTEPIDCEAGKGYGLLCA